MIEAALYEYLNRSLTSGRAYHQDAPQDAVLPFVVFSLSGRDEDRSRVSNGLIYSVFEIDCYADQADSAAVFGKAVRDLLEGHTGDMEGEIITLSQISNEFDSTESASNSFVRTMTLSINNVRN